MNKEHFSIPKGLVTVVISTLMSTIGLLAGGYLYFIAKTLDKLESIERIAMQSRQDIAVIQAVQDTQLKKYLSKGE